MTHPLDKDENVLVTVLVTNLQTGTTAQASSATESIEEIGQRALDELLGLLEVQGGG